jgi:adenylyl-sulfate kinase
MSAPAQDDSSIVLTEAQLNELELALGGLLAHGFPASSLLIDVEHTVIARVLADRELVALRPFGHRPFSTHRVTRPGELHGDVVVIDDSPAADVESVDCDAVVVLDRGDHDRLGRAVRAARALHSTVFVLPVPPRLDRDGIEHLVTSAGAQSITWLPTVVSKSGGVVVMFTGLSGSGKSTVARSLADHLRQTDERPVTLLDGDEVRTMLSAGLGFSRSDRELNVRRLTWVAALVARHGGIALCAPIAPYESMRADARRKTLDAAAEFVLVHVATPIEVCERRDRKGLYARARAGEIEHFTGVSDPYEIPVQTDLQLDTSVQSIEQCVAEVLLLLARRGGRGTAA